MDNNDYVIVERLNMDINNLGTKINDLSCANIVNDSSKINIDKTIKVINKEIKKVDRENNKRTCIKNLKIFTYRFLKVFPFLIGLLIAFMIFHGIFNDIPFYPQDEVNTKHYEETFDSLGNTTINSWYSPDGNDHNFLHVYDKWTENYWGTPDRYSSLYPIDNYTKEDYKEVLNNSEQIMKDNNYYRVDLYEQNEEITEEDKQLNGYMKAIFHYDDKEDTVIRAQDEDANIKKSFYFLAILFGFEVVIGAICNDENDNSSQSVNDLKNKYNEIDISDIKRQFKEKRMAYEALKGSKPKDINDILDRKVLVK